jgi:hypothetical protein
MGDLTERIDNFIEKSSRMNGGKGFKDLPVEKGVFSTINRIKGNPNSQKIIIPQKLNYNPVTLERVNKQLAKMVNKLSSRE